MTAMSELSHVDPDGAVRMVDVGDKPLSRRRAVARATVLMAPETVARLGELPKGDALTTAQLAGIMAAKRTSELIPLCHPLPLTVDRRRRSRSSPAGVEIEATAETTAQTGVEMEALTAASVAALTVYDMAKAIDKSMVDHRRHAGREDEGGRVKAAVLTVSDGVHHGTREDRSGDTLAELLEADGFAVERRIVPDERDEIAGGDRRARRPELCRVDNRRHRVHAARRHARGDAERCSTGRRRASRRRSAPTRSPGRRTRCSLAASPGSAERR